MSELTISHLTKRFGDKLVLDDVSLTVEKGDIFGILGVSGAGKSTLVRCINGLETFDSGEIYFRDKLLLSPDIRIGRSDRMRIAMIFQSFNLLHQSTALKNVMLALEIKGYDKKLRKEKAMECLRRVGLADKAKRYPSQLSGGEKQRVAIARALALDPEIILSDEATSALDPETTQEILALLASLNKEYGITIIMISHQMEAIEGICNKVAIIDKAKIVEEGETYEIFLQPKSEAAKRILYSHRAHGEMSKNGLIRIIFGGNIDEPIISEIVQDCNILVSIVHADTRVQEGKVYGVTTIQRPENEKDRKKLFRFFELKGLQYEELWDESPSKPISGSGEGILRVSRNQEGGPKQ